MSTGLAQLAFPPAEADLEAGRDHGLPNEAQAEYLELSTDVQVIVGGFGTGKTSGGAFKSSEFMLANPGCRGMAIGPTHRHAEIMQQEMLRLFELVRLRCGINLVANAPTSPSNRYIELTCGSRVTFYSGVKKAGVLGQTVAFVWLDELEWFDDPEEILNAVPSRLRQQSQPGVSTINRRRTFITSTAQFLTGPLKDFIEERDLEELRKNHELKDDKYRGGLVDGVYYPDTGVVVAPSTVAVDHGLTLDIIRRWQREMEPSAFRRAVMCVLESPPEIIFGDCLSAEQYPDGNVVDGIDAKFQADRRSFFLVDWGIRCPHILFCQYDAERNALIVIDEYGPDGSSVGETIRAMVEIGKRYGIVDPRTNALSRQCKVIGDPTTNPGASPSKPLEQHALALEGMSALRNLGWPYSFPHHPRQRSKRLQIQLLRALFRPADKKPRILISRALTLKRDEHNRPHKLTRRGIWHALVEGYRYQRDSQGRITDTPKKDGKWDHAIDALAYGAVMIFDSEFSRLLDLETGLLSGAGAWQ